MMEGMKKTSSKRRGARLGLKPSAKPKARPTRRKAARLGQHFLMHPAIARRIAAAAGLSAGDTVLEVGPGKGMLTRALLVAGARVVAVETDAHLANRLAGSFASEIADGSLVLANEDIRGYLAGKTAELAGPYRVVANIPYYLTGELTRALLTRAHQPASMTLLVQKEVAERIARSAKESLLSLSIKAYGEPRYEFTVPRGAFVPAPKVDSAVLSIRNISRAHFSSSADEDRFFALIHAGFAHKRKRLGKNFAEAGLPRAPVLDNARAEDLALADWLALTGNV